MTYFLKKKKWMAWVVLLTFLFTSFMPTNLLAGNSVAEAANYSKTIKVGETIELGNYRFDREWQVNTEGIVQLSAQQGNMINITGIKAGEVKVTATSEYFGSDTWTVKVEGDSPITPPEVQGDVALGKTAERVGADEWKITMTIGADSQTIEAEPMNIVLVIDRSYSMVDTKGNPKFTSAKNAAKTFVTNINNLNVKANIGVVGFSGKATIYQNLTSAKDNTNLITQAIQNIPLNNGYTDNPGTNISEALTTAAGRLSGKQNPYIVLLSDGAPTEGITSWTKLKEHAQSIKNTGVKIITIAYDVNSSLSQNFNSLSSGEGYHFSAGVSESDLNSIFQAIQDQILYVMASGTVTDDMGNDVDIVLGEDGVTSDDYTVSTGSVTMDENGKLIWNIPDKVTKDHPATLIYTVKVKNLVVGDQTPVLNGNAGLAYKDSNNESHSATFENPKGNYQAGQLVVSYDGLPSTVTPSWTDGYTVDADGTWKSAVKVTDYPNEPATVSFPSVNDVADYQVSSVTVTLPDGASETLTLGEFNTKYTGNSLTLQKGMSSIVYHYTTSVTLTKVDGDNNNAPMAGVSFTLTEAATQTNIAAAVIAGKYAQTKQTNASGQMTFDGLELGKSYTLSETAPNGYKTKGPWTLIVNADGTVTISGSDGVISGNQIVNERRDDLSYKVNYLEKIQMKY